MSYQFKIGSLFDGSGGFPLAAALCGGIPTWASEVEPYPIAVTRSRFPGMKHLGDISKINGAEIDPVDVITFGSPCQDLSVAGKRAGLKHEANGDEETTRSGLFMEAVRIIKEMREATNGKYPSFALWENVPGAFSSNKGEDFRVVIEELIKIVEPTATVPAPGKNGWPYADCYVGTGWSLAYRTFDAQYWGVPQRRRRIHLVLDLRGERAAEVLFERDGLRGYFAESGAPWQAVAGDAEDCVGAADREGISGVIPINTMVATRHKQLGRGTCFGVGEAGDPQFTISAGHEHAVCYAEIADTHILDDQGGSQINVRTDGKYPTLRAEMHGNVPCVMKPICFIDGDKIGKADRAGCSGLGIRPGSHTGQDAVNDILVAGPDSAKVYRQGGFADYVEGEVGTLRAAGGDYGGGTENLLVERIAIRNIVSRLTPTECARLQGFADRWGDIDSKADFSDEEHEFWLEVRNTHAAINGKTVKDYTKAQMLTWYSKLQTDSAEYKMWGNGVCIFPVLYCMQGIVDALQEVEAL